MGSWPGSEPCQTARGYTERSFQWPSAAGPAADPGSSALLGRLRRIPAPVHEAASRPREFLRAHTAARHTRARFHVPPKPAALLLLVVSTPAVRSGERLSRASPSTPVGLQSLLPRTLHPAHVRLPPGLSPRASPFRQHSPL